MKTVIQLVNVSKSFKGNALLENVNLQISEGEIVGFIGHNGSGKSVLFKLISGIYRPDCGKIIVRDKELGKENDFPENTGILIDSPGFIDIYTGFQNLKYLASIRNKIDDAAIEKYMNLVGLDPENKTRVKNYSLGMKQKLAIAQAIMEDQDILLLDEPFNALDESSHKNMLDLMLELQKDGKTILLTSHNLGDIESVCQRRYQIQDHTLKEVL